MVEEDLEVNSAVVASGKGEVLPDEVFGAAVEAVVIS